MKKTAVLMVASWMPVFLLSCVSFRISPPLQPENSIGTMVLCKNVEQKGELLYPEGIQEEFQEGLEPVHCFVRLHNVRRVIRLKWNWYDPQGKLCRKTDDLVVNRSEAYLEAVTAFDKIQAGLAEGAAGRWSVILFVDGVLAGRRSFVLDR